MEISDLRKEYLNLNLRRKDLSINPFDQFHAWFQEAVRKNIIEPNSMQLATCLDNVPSIRTVLLKKYDDGFTFFTNLKSRKSRELKMNNKASLLFLWKEMERQIIIEGTVSEVPHNHVEVYFAERPRTSQLGACVSEQDRIIPDRKFLEERYSECRRQYEGKKIPLPEHWGGFKVTPYRFEFWQGRPFRLHDRFQYTLKEQEWAIERLSP